ncbi:MAG TPA: nitrite reductase small subunit NirD [Piscirickettsiaceae bacterium]|nr:nitrite reductase small subunit NirD [Piscirickettsiaceae bacterium]HIQ40455.1 nitrite reductase small subunit NirD [Sulfurivirga caldicuralii]
MAFVKVCEKKDLIQDAGIAAKVGDVQIALFYIDDQVYAVGNHDPASGANVIFRGICGDLNGELMVASPLYKDHYSLITGQHLDGKDLSIPVYAAKIEGEDVLVDVASSSTVAA